MTIKELYEYAKELGKEDYEIEIRVVCGNFAKTLSTTYSEYNFNDDCKTLKL